MDVNIEFPEIDIDLGIQRITEKDHSKLINRDLDDQHPISSITGLQEALDNSGKINDVKVNNTSVVTDKVANINLKTINNQSIQGIGNIDIDVENVVKTTANQNLTTQQKANARNNIEVLGREDVKQSTGNSTTDVISQKGVTDLLAEKQDNKPDGTHLLISNDTGKLDLTYIPSTVLGGITNGGTFNGSGIITASSYAPELDGEVIDEVAFGSYPSYYFICSSPYSFAGFDFSYGDWAISLGNGWAKLNATDAVTSVNGKMGQVVLNYTDVGAVKSTWGIDNANKNLVTDSAGNVTTSDYALGQIIVDYYDELPTNVPETAKASVLKPSYTINPLIYENLDTYYSEQLGDIFIEKSPTLYGLDQYIYFTDNDIYQYQISDTSGTTIEGEPVLVFLIENSNTGETISYLYSLTNQKYISDESLEIKVGWNKLYYDETEQQEKIIQVSYRDIPKIDTPYLLYYDCNQAFLNNIGTGIINLAGEYIYTEVQPSTTPKTYYWKYTPSNVQSDMSEEDTFSLAYIKNRATLNTTNTTALTSGSETIKGTINLHKVSKTGTYSDLINPVGMVDTQGEIFNTYSGNNKNIASGYLSHAEGERVEASGSISHAEGIATIAYGRGSHSEGVDTQANGSYSHSEGNTTIANGNSSHAEGEGTQSNSSASHAEGQYTITNSVGSHAEGVHTIASGSSQHVQGKFNVEDSQGTYAHIVGNGTNDNARSNAHTLDWNGNAWFKGNVRVGGTSWDTGTPIGGGGGGSTAKKKTLTNASQNYSVSNNVVTVTDSDVSTSTHIELYPADTTTETWLENNLSSCIITETSGSFSFNISASLPATFSMYYIIMEVE